MKGRALAFASNNHPLKIAFFGDSIAAGLGARGKGYPVLVCQELEAELIPYYKSGATIADSLSAWRQGPTSFDFAVVAHGITEPIHRPLVANNRWIPSRWRRRGWMDPRPYYSTRRARRYLERAESELRWRVKNYLLKQDSMQLMSVEEYATAHSQLVESLRTAGTKVFILEPPHLDDRFFPGSPSEQRRYYNAVCADDRAEAVPITNRLNMWSDYLADKFHPNCDGHVAIATAIIEKMMRTLP